LDRAIAVENKWRAQRYGVDCSFVTKSGPVALVDFLSQLINRVADDAEHLQCRREVEHCKTIALSGSSADHQLRAAELSSTPLAAAKRYIADTTIGRVSHDHRTAGNTPAVSDQQTASEEF
jgi:carboxylate-amine ligase